MYASSSTHPPTRSRRSNIATLVAIALTILCGSYLLSTSNETYQPPQRKLSHSVTSGEDSPHIAWLLSFPLSGADYITDYFTAVTKRTTATNYGNTVQDELGHNRRSMVESIPIFNDRPHGPFLFTPHLPHPSSTSFVPTTSYCTAYCNDCYPGRYIMNRDDFLRGCVTATKFLPEAEGPNGPTGRGDQVDNQYDAKLVNKAIVLIRNPFHVVQERFLHFSHSFEKLSHRDHEWLPHFNMNADGLKAYCDEAEVKFAEEEAKWYSQSVFDASRGVPCHAEFYRYVSWLNLVFEVLDYLEIPFNVVHYKDLRDNFTNTMDGLMDFYELETDANVTADDIPKIRIQGDRGYFKDEDKALIQDLIQLIASPTTNSHIGMYV